MEHERSAAGGVLVGASGQVVIGATIILTATGIAITYPIGAAVELGSHAAYQSSGLHSATVMYTYSEIISAREAASASSPTGMPFGDSADIIRRNPHGTDYINGRHQAAVSASRHKSSSSTSRRATHYRISRGIAWLAMLTVVLASSLRTTNAPASTSLLYGFLGVGSAATFVIHSWSEWNGTSTLISVVINAALILLPIVVTQACGAAVGAWASGYKSGDSTNAEARVDAFMCRALYTEKFAAAVFWVAFIALFQAEHEFHQGIWFTLEQETLLPSSGGSGPTSP
jgi:hypothetical protein